MAGGLTGPQQVRRAVRRALAGCGLDEAITYTFVGPEALTALGLPEGDVRLEPVRLANPMSVEQSVMRTSMLPGLLATVRANVDHLNDPPNLFELGRVYLWDDAAIEAPAHAAEPGALLPHEREEVAVVLAGPLQSEHWTGGARPTDFFALKGVVETLLGALRLSGSYAPLGEAAAAHPYLHPGKAATVSVAGAGPLGFLGLLRPDVAAAFGLEDLEVHVAALELERLDEVAMRGAGFEDLGTYPPAEQDLAVVVGRDVPAADVVAVGRPRRRQADAQRARLRRVRGRPDPGRQALPGATRRDALAGTHAEREGHRRRARQDPQGARARVRGDAAVGVSDGRGRRQGHEVRAGRAA